MYICAYMYVCGYIYIHALMYDLGKEAKVVVVWAYH